MASDKPDWFQKEVKNINPDAQRLLETYSGFEPDQVLPHVLSLVMVFVCSQIPSNT